MAESQERIIHDMLAERIAEALRELDRYTLVQVGIPFSDAHLLKKKRGRGLPTELGDIDILAVRPTTRSGKRHNYDIVEVKNGRTMDGAIGQLNKIRDYLKEAYRVYYGQGGGRIPSLGIGLFFANHSEVRRIILSDSGHYNGYKVVGKVTPENVEFNENI